MNTVQQKIDNGFSNSVLHLRSVNALLKDNRVLEATKYVEDELTLNPDDPTLHKIHRVITTLKCRVKSETCQIDNPINAGQNNAHNDNQQTYLINDEHYWDEYVRNWEVSEENKGLRYIGNEWKGENIFLTLLDKYSNNNYTVLEIGCGGGRVTSAAIKLFKHVKATDVSKEMLRKCKESIREQNITLYKIDGFTLKEFADESMDFAFSHDVFVHFSSLQVYPYFREMKRVLRKGGIGLVSFYNFRVHFDLFKKMSLDYNNQRLIPPHMRVHFVTEEMLRIMLEDLNLEIVEIEKTNFLIVAFRK